MKKGQVYQGIVERVAFPNKGVITLEDGKKAIVKNVIPGQKVSFSINKIRKGRGEGRYWIVLRLNWKKLLALILAFAVGAII